jgi:hypothetical protein
MGVVDLLTGWLGIALFLVSGLILVCAHLFYKTSSLRDKLLDLLVIGMIIAVGVYWFFFSR